MKTPDDCELREARGTLEALGEDVGIDAVTYAYLELVGDDTEWMQHHQQALQMRVRDAQQEMAERMTDPDGDGPFADTDFTATDLVGDPDITLPVADEEYDPVVWEVDDERR